MNIVQIGCNDGNDDAYKYISKYKNNIENLVLVEPLTEFNEDLHKRYSGLNYYIENSIITDTEDKEMAFYVVDGAARNFTEISSLDSSHIQKHGQSKIKEMKLPAMNINQLFEKYNLSTIDHLYIDAEGYDARIIKSINFDKFYIDRIEYENLHIDNDDIEKFLHDKGFFRLGKVGKNGWSTLVMNSLSIEITDYK